MPSPFSCELLPQQDSSVEMTVESGRIVLVPVPDSRVPSLAELLEKITEENRHTEVGTGEPSGNETW